MTELYINDLLYSISYALDFVEREITGISHQHSKRVAYLTTRMGKAAGYSKEELLHLAAAAALHDNGLSEYQQTLWARGEQMTPETIQKTLGLHCEYGERSVRQLPFYPHIQGAIHDHHERADGQGPFGKRVEETCVFARLIHIIDAIDTQFDLSRVTPEKYQAVCEELSRQRGKAFDTDTVEWFLQAFPNAQSITLHLRTLDRDLKQELPESPAVYSANQLIQIAGFFARIIDFKSAATCRHSIGIARKAGKMGQFYGWDETIQARLYLAGALHDIGKLMVRSDILEKPGKLTADEYQHIQNHAHGSYLVLHEIRGLEEVAGWAYLHHEKLDGSGYPFGKTAQQLSHKERLMACLDIYQALVEPRPYKEGLSHKKAISILKELAGKGKLDSQITADIDSCFQNERI